MDRKYALNSISLLMERYSNSTKSKRIKRTLQVVIIIYFFYKSIIIY